MSRDVIPPQSISFFQNRLCSLFKIAEEQIIFHLLKPLDNQGLNLLRDASKLCQERFLEQIMQPSEAYEGQEQIDYVDVTRHLNEWLTKFTITAYLGLYGYIKTPVHEYFVYFPGNIINWRQLLLHFHMNEKETKSSVFDVSEDTVERIFSVVFYNVLLQVFEKKDIFNENISTILKNSDLKIIGLLNTANNDTFEDYLRHYYHVSPQLNIRRAEEFNWQLDAEHQRFNDNGFSSYIPSSIAERVSLKEGLRRLSDLLSLQRISLKSLKQSMPDDQIYNYVAKIRGQKTQQEKENPQKRNEKVQDVMSKQVKPQITILPEHRKAILEALTPYVTSGLDSLELLLAAEDATDPVIIKGRPGNALAYVFRQAQKAGHINNAKSEIGWWLVHWFIIEDEGGQRELSYKSVYPDLTKDKKPSKKSRIPYNP